MQLSLSVCLSVCLSLSVRLSSLPRSGVKGVKTSPCRDSRPGLTIASINAPYLFTDNSAVIRTFLPTYYVLLSHKIKHSPNRRPSFSSRRKSPLERSSTRRYVSSDSRCFPKAAQNLSFLSFVHVVTDAPRTDRPFSGLAVFDYRPL